MSWITSDDINPANFITARTFKEIISDSIELHRLLSFINRIVLLNLLKQLHLKQLLLEHFSLYIRLQKYCFSIYCLIWEGGKFPYNNNYRKTSPYIRFYAWMKNRFCLIIHIFWNGRVFYERACRWKSHIRYTALRSMFHYAFRLRFHPCLINGGINPARGVR